MTEQEWLRHVGQPIGLLLELGHRGGFITGRPGHRRLRLFAVACARRLWPSLRDERSREVILAAERFADRPTRKWKVALAAAYQAARGSPAEAWSADRVVQAVGEASAWDAAQGAAGWVAHCRWRAGGDAARAEEWRAQCDLVREVFANPFRAPSAVDPGWLAWNGASVPRLAEAIYAERTFDRLAVLADALEAAGCDSAEILAHLRGPGPHVRGCWAVDLILGKQ